MSPEVVQEIIAIFLAFTKILSSAPVYELARTKAGDFTRARGSLQLPRLLQYVPNFLTVITSREIQSSV